MDDKEKTYQYYAFISYSGADEKWAKWLHRRLENYHIPSRLCKKYPSLPRRIKPIFWYKVDLSGTVIKKALKREIDSSRYLILICSPLSARAPWVNDEVEAFIESHGAHNIIPFIVDGEPHAPNRDKECFPPALLGLGRDEELRGINVAEMGRRRAVVDVIATMFDVRFDALWRRHLRAFYRKCAVLAMCAIAMIVGGVVAYNFFKTTKTYYETYELCKGMPVGIGPIEAKDLKKRFVYYTFETSQGKLRRVLYTNRWGGIMNTTSSWSQFKEAIMELSYEKSRLSSITYRDKYKRPLYKMVFSEDYTRADLKDTESGDATSLFKSISSISENMMPTLGLDIDKLFIDTKSQIARYVFDYDEDGYIKRMLFKKYNGSNETGYDESGISGIEYTRDDMHRVIKKRYLGEDDRYMEDKYGCAGIEYKYDDNGYVSYERFFDKNGDNCVSDLQYSISRITYDLPSMTITECHYDTDEQPCITSLRFSKSVDELKGDTLISSYYDAEGLPVVMFADQTNYGLFHISKTVINKKGFPKEEYFFDTSGLPSYNSAGTHSIKYEYNEDGILTKSSNFDTDGNPCKDIMGVAELRFNINDNGNLISINSYDETGQLINVMGRCTIRYNYDGNRVIKISNFDKNGMPAASPATMNAAVLDFKYDDFGNVTDVWRGDGSGTYDNIGDDVSVHVKARYKDGRCVSLTSYNSKDEIVMDENGLCIMKMEYDSRGNRKYMAYFDENENRMVQVPFNAAYFEYEYDDYGHEIVARAYDAEGKPTLCSDGWAERRNEYKNNQISRISAYGKNGEPILVDNAGVHIKTFDYDKNRRLISERNYDRNDNPMINNFGFFETRYEYDNRGFPVVYSFFDTNGAPVENMEGYHKQIMEYNDRNLPIKESFFDRNDRPAICKRSGYATAIRTYDERGKMLDETFYDTDNNLADNPMKGYAKMIFRYNDDDNIECMIFLDKDLSLTEVYQFNSILASSVALYDENRQNIAMVYLDDENDVSQIGAMYVENGNLVGYLSRGLWGDATLRMPNGETRTYDGFYTLHRDSVAEKIHNYLDSLGNEAKRTVERHLETL